MPSPRILLVALLALAASLVAAGPAGAAAADRVFTLDPLTNKLKFKPAKLSFSDRDMTELRWSRWGKPVARARGIARILTCEPSCGAGGAETTATTVKLSRIRERNGKRVYTCMSWRDDEKVTDLPASNSLNPFNFRPCKAPGASARHLSASAVAG
jgi:hypothetical protein